MFFLRFCMKIIHRLYHYLLKYKFKLYFFFICVNKTMEDVKFIDAFLQKMHVQMQNFRNFFSIFFLRTSLIFLYIYFLLK